MDRPLGYARVPKIINQLGRDGQTYLAKRISYVSFTSSTRATTHKLELQLHEWLKYSAKPRLIVATKSDKLSNNELRESVGRAKRMFGEESVVAYSARTGHGRAEVWRAIENALSLN